ncbi:DUF2239 family protein [Hyphomicrobium sp.]|uniref:DUF2239 family protein n=1 Tax=Hyphomicrobium sp. TaxID=82 RepID=UPI001D62D036|nr:DUF2239 family protein [Hyphomicrobium sp.]MBY0558363.1 DUF2239 family protein [Hyphomicrobium sp.]
MDNNFTAFDGRRRFVSGSRAEVIAAIRTRSAKQPDMSLLIFDDSTGNQIDFDLRESADIPVARLQKSPSSSTGAEEARSPGRPKLGVVPREVTLLPRHWEWLAAQPGGASVTLRKLVDDARRKNADAEIIRTARERAYRFMSAMAGNLAGFEEATRALFAGDRQQFEKLTAKWSADVRDYTHSLADGAFGPEAENAVR